MSIESEFHLAIQLHQSGQLAQALKAYQRLLVRVPEHAQLLHYTGLLLCQTGKSAEGTELLYRSIGLKPDDGEVHQNLGNALKDQGKISEAIAAYRRAVELLPGVARNHNNLGGALVMEGRLEEAVLCLRQALQVDPMNATAAKNLGIAMARLGNHAEAAAAFRKATQLLPNQAELHASLARSLHLQGNYGEAVIACRRALQIKPDFLKANITLALAYRAELKLEESSLACQAAIRIDPGCADARWMWSLNCLTLGDFERGWAEYEWRLKSFAPQKSYSQPQWRGELLNGRTVLLHSEQGFGDTLHFVRYAPLVAARGGIVLVQCQRELVALLSRMPGITGVYSDEDELPGFDVQCPFMSLPLAFATNLSNIPAKIPYLIADLQARAAFRSAHLGTDRNLKVGLVWAGRPTHANDRNRSISLAMLAPLTALSGITFYSLQKGEAAREINSIPLGSSIADLSEQLTDFDQTAAAVSELDLVVTVDTSTAHLCGALGVPVWVLVPFVPDWRWLLHREDSPWYPTMRLFRQKAPGEWEPVIDRLRGALVELKLK